MIISHQYRFIFVKNLKTAGTSIEVYLSPLCGAGDAVTPIWPTEPGHQPRNDAGFYNHMPAHEIRDVVGADTWNEYLTFTVERNPWDKTVSHFAMERHRSGGQLDWDSYMVQGTPISTRFMYTDPSNDEIIVDHVLRYESLNEDLGRVFGELALPWAGSLDVRAKSGYRQDGKPYREWFSPSQRERVARAFAWEIETFGYEF